MAPREDFAAELFSLRRLAIRDLIAGLARGNLTSPATAFATLESVFTDLVTVYGEQAAMSAARYLEIDRAAAGVLRSLPGLAVSGGVPGDQVRSSLSWAVAPLGAGDQALTRRQLEGTLLRLVQQPARETIWDSTRRAGTTYARRPLPGACDWCLMLSSRGAVYTADSVSSTTGRSTGSSGRPEGLSYHDWCGCIPVEVRTPDDLPPENRLLQDLWESNNSGGDLNSWSRFLAENPVRL